MVGDLFTELLDNRGALHPAVRPVIGDIAQRTVEYAKVVDATDSTLPPQPVSEEEDTKAGIITMPHLRKRRAQHVYPVPRGAEEKASHHSLANPALTNPHLSKAPSC